MPTQALSQYMKALAALEEAQRVYLQGSGWTQVGKTNDGSYTIWHHPDAKDGPTGLQNPGCGEHRCYTLPAAVGWQLKHDNYNRLRH